MGRKRIDEDELRSAKHYPLFGFRVSEKDKKTLSKDLEALVKLYNTDTYGPTYKKKDIFLKALGIGFKELRRRKEK